MIFFHTFIIKLQKNLYLLINIIQINYQNLLANTQIDKKKMTIFLSSYG